MCDLIELVVLFFPGLKKLAMQVVKNCRHVYIWVFEVQVLTVRYHDDASKELNACIRFLLHMVYL